MPLPGVLSSVEAHHARQEQTGEIEREKEEEGKKWCLYVYLHAYMYLLVLYNNNHYWLDHAVAVSH